MNGKLLEDVDIQELPDFEPHLKGHEEDDSDEIKRQIENSEEYWFNFSLMKLSLIIIHLFFLVSFIL